MYQVYNRARSALSRFALSKMVQSEPNLSRERKANADSHDGLDFSRWDYGVWR